MVFKNQMKMGIIDLTSNTVTFEEVLFTDEKVKKYLGGEGVVIEYLLKNMPVNVDPLSPDNHLCFITGILSATKVPFSGRYTVVCKSPLTGGWGEANSGGRFGPELRKTGIDSLIIKGKANGLSIIVVTDDGIEIKSAKQLKGIDCVQTEDELKKEYGKKAQVASIGLAGENLVLFSGIVTDKGRIAARSGVGAVMGSKNLKAIVVRGTKTIPIADPAGLNELRKLVNKRINKGIRPFLKPGLKASTTFAPWIRRFRIKNFGSMSPSNMIIESYRRWGTCAGSAILVETGDAPIKNWKGSYIDFPLKKSSRITGDNVTKFQVKNYTCHSCPMACGGKIKFSNEQFTLEETHKPEYETLIMLGANLLNDDIGAIYQLNDYCNRQGLDTIAAGAILAFVIESLESGKIPRDVMNGLNPTWGDPKDYLSLLKIITTRRGIGNILADGFEHASELYDTDCGMHIQNQAIPAHDPRFSNSMVISYKLDPAPGRHTPFSELMIDLAKFSQMFPELPKSDRISDFYCYHKTVSSLGLCQFSLLTGNFPVLEFVNLITGFDLTIEDMVTIGERILNLKHLFNLREGKNPLEYKLPERTLEKAERGPNKAISASEEKKLITNFLMSLNWDTATTMPNEKRLRTLGLGEFV
ncbi:MAG: aldehyde ferredoxin oxidoreductase family protein [Candidatus Hodarchaeales archaeon]|jgi:aldehyde:ferredoxin oxidoreductase